MFVAFMGNMNLHLYKTMYTIICLTFIKIVLITLPTKLCPHQPGKFWLPTTLTPENKLIPNY